MIWVSAADVANTLDETLGNLKWEFHDTQCILQLLWFCYKLNPNCLKFYEIKFNKQFSNFLK